VPRPPITCRPVPCPGVTRASYVAVMSLAWSVGQPRDDAGRTVTIPAEAVGGCHLAIGSPCGPQRPDALSTMTAQARRLRAVVIEAQSFWQGFAISRMTGTQASASPAG
jgi:hypothetical protein